MDSKQALLGKLAHIFSDAVVDEAEKSSLRAFLASGELTTQELREVFEEFVATTWKEAMADNHVSDIEKQRLREIVRVLGLDASVLPAEWRSQLKG
jgi:tellurite resistance protein